MNHIIICKESGRIAVYKSSVRDLITCMRKYETKPYITLLLKEYMRHQVTRTM